MKCSLSIFSFVTCAFGVISKKIIPKYNVIKLLSYVLFFPFIKEIVILIQFGILIRIRAVRIMFYQHCSVTTLL